MTDKSNAKQKLNMNTNLSIGVQGGIVSKQGIGGLSDLIIRS
jgi:hypothetical protein